MKSLRHRKIIEIIERKPVETQEDLAEELKSEGFNVTQATVSRDIRELSLYKVSTEGTGYRYAVPGGGFVNQSQTKNRRILQDSIVRIDFSENIIVIKTSPGSAQAVARIVDDNESWQEIIGTVAGDDTVFVVVKPKTAVQQVITRIESYLR